MNRDEQKRSSLGGAGSTGLVEQAKQVASHVADQAKEQVTHRLDTTKDEAAHKIEGVADALEWTSGKLKDVGPLGDVTHRAAEGMQGVVSFLEKNDVREVIRGVERFARREPALFLGAAFAVGLLGARFLKSGVSQDETDEGFGTSGSRGYRDDEWGAGGTDYLSSDELEEYESKRFGAEDRGTRGYGTSSSPGYTRGGQGYRQGQSYGGTSRTPSTGTGSSLLGDTPSTGKTGSIRPDPIVNVDRPATSTTATFGSSGSPTAGRSDTEPMPARKATTGPTGLGSPTTDPSGATPAVSTSSSPSGGTSGGGMGRV